MYVTADGISCFSCSTPPPLPPRADTDSILTRESLAYVPPPHHPAPIDSIPSPNPLTEPLSLWNQNSNNTIDPVALTTASNKSPSAATHALTEQCIQSTWSASRQDRSLPLRIRAGNNPPPIPPKPGSAKLRVVEHPGTRKQPPLPTRSVTKTKSDILPPPLLSKGARPPLPATVATTNTTDPSPPLSSTGVRSPLPATVATTNTTDPSPPLSSTGGCPLQLNLAEQVDDRLPPRCVVRKHLIPKDDVKDKPIVLDNDPEDNDEVFLRYNESYHTIINHFSQYK